MNILPHLVGAALIVIAVTMLIRPAALAGWLGKPAGWQWFWESFRGSPGAGQTVYNGYKTYTTIAGWFWLITTELLLWAFGLYLLITGQWL